MMGREVLDGGFEMKFLLSIVGCATAKTIIGPDGTENQLIASGSIEQCYEKAREVCGGKYNIANVTGESFVYHGNGGSQSNLLVKCENKK